MMSLTKLVTFNSFLILFSNATATTEIYTFPYTTLFRSCRKRSIRECHSHIGGLKCGVRRLGDTHRQLLDVHQAVTDEDRKSTRLNSSHVEISYAVFCLKKKKR